MTASSKGRESNDEASADRLFSTGLVSPWVAPDSTPGERLACQARKDVSGGARSADFCTTLLRLWDDPAPSITEVGVLSVRRSASVRAVFRVSLAGLVDTRDPHV